MARTAARRVLGSKKRPAIKLGTKRGGTKIKLKIKAKSPEGLANAVDKLAKGITKS